MSDRRTVLLGLVRGVSTLDEARAFLKERGLPHSASGWEQMIQERLAPGLASGVIDEADLITYVREAEEFGRQHVFLYTRPADMPMPTESQVVAWLQSRGEERLLTDARILDKPPAFTLADVRWEAGDLVLKAVETRTYRKLVNEHAEDGGRFINVRYELEQNRAVTVVRLCQAGRVDVRVYSHKSGPQKYADDLRRALNLVADLLPVDRLEPLPLLRAKARLWEDRERLRQQIRYSNAEFRDDQSNTARLSSGSKGDNLFDSRNAEASLVAFNGDGGAHCSSFNLWWLQDGGGTNLPASDIHVLITGNMNEFAITTQCTRADYEYILTQLEGLNV